jgi:hypothetical protein
MGNLTDDMTRLREEVDALRGARGALMQDLSRGARDLAATVSAIRADFTSAHAAMAKQSRGEREAFVAAMIGEVNSLLGAFSQDRNDMARKGKVDRGVFLSEMRRQVMGMCKDTADDLMGARLAWSGASPRKSRPLPIKKIPAFVKPIPPPMEAALKKTVAAPEIKIEKPPVTFMEPLKKEEEKKTVAAPEAPAVETPKVKAPPSVSASKPPLQKSKKEPAG